MSGPDAAYLVVGIAAAVLLALNVLVPPLMVSLGWRRLRSFPVASPEAARPTGDEPTYRKLFDQFVTLGFEPAGADVEVGWFLSVWDWRKSFRQRWLASSDGQTFATISKLIPEEPWRFSLGTVLSDGCIVRTSCPGADGVGNVVPDYRFARLPGADPTELLARHREHVDLVCRERGASIATMTMVEMAVREAVLGEAVINEQPHSHGGLYRTFFLMPALLTVTISYFVNGGVRLTSLVWAIGIPSLIMRLVRDFVAMPALRTAILASHSDPRR